MPWIQTAVPREAIAYGQLLMEMLTALTLGLVIVGVFRFVRRRQCVDPTFPVTLVLLAVLIAIVTRVIGSDIARAFSLVGALSIVRFRTVVDDTLDIGFVIFAVVIGMAVGSGQWPFAAMGTVVVGAAAICIHEVAVRQFSAKVETVSAIMKIRLTIGSEPKQRLDESLQQQFSHVDVISSETSRGGSAVDIRYRVTMAPTVDPIHVVNSLNAIVGIQSVFFERELTSKRNS